MEYTYGFVIGFLYASLGVVAMVYLSASHDELDELIGESIWKAILSVFVWPLLFIWVKTRAFKRYMTRQRW